MTVNAYVGWDIGGAHLKVAQVDRAGKVIFARQFATPLWQGIDILSQSLEQSRNLITEKSVRHAVTTTAELVDIFPDRISGLKQLTECITAILDKNSIQYFSGKSGWISTASTAEFANQIASANWYATASFIAKHFDNGIMLDIGSTTTDIVAFTNGEILNRGYSDYERLTSGELVYTGIIRTPVMALVQELPVDSAWCPVIAEHFATMADVYRLTGELQEEDDMLDTADRAGKSVLGSTRRLARMVGKDIYTGEAIQDWHSVAQYIAQTGNAAVHPSPRAAD